MENAEKAKLYEEEFNKYAEENPELASDIKRELICLSNVDDSDLQDAFALVKIPVTQLSEFGTSCGTVGNRPFTSKAIKMLQVDNDFVFAIILREDLNICCMLARMSEEDGQEFSDLIDNNKGSLRYDVSRVGDWASFESE